MIVNEYFPYGLQPDTKKTDVQSESTIPSFKSKSKSIQFTMAL